MRKLKVPMPKRYLDRQMTANAGSRRRLEQVSRDYETRVMKARAK